MIQAYIFDLDGTLLDSEVVWVQAHAEMLRRLGLAISADEALGMVYGKAFRDVCADIRQRFPSVTWTNEEMAARSRVIFRQLAHQRDIRIPGSIDLLARLALRHRVCLVSGSSRTDVDEGIRLVGIGAQLQFSLASEDYAPGKPDPAGFLLAAHKLKVEPACCLVFEDSEAGVRAAKAAGMKCVALARPGSPAQDFSTADLVLPDLAKFHPEN